MENTCDKEKMSEFLKDYAELVKRYGMVWGYDGGWGTPEEIHPVDINNKRVAEWLDDLSSGKLESMWLYN